MSEVVSFGSVEIRACYKISGEDCMAHVREWAGTDGHSLNTQVKVLFVGSVWYIEVDV